MSATPRIANYPHPATRTAGTARTSPAEARPHTKKSDTEQARAESSDAYVRNRPSADEHAHQQEQSFWKGARQGQWGKASAATSSSPLNQGSFKTREEYEATLASARRVLGQNQNTEFGGASSAGDRQQLTHKQQEALRLYEHTRQTAAQHEAQQARLRRQNANNTQVEQSTLDLSFSGQRLSQNYVETVDAAAVQAGKGLRAARTGLSNASEWAFSSRSIASAQATETQLRQQKYDKKAMAQNPERARLAITYRQEADKHIAADAHDETWQRRAFEQSQADKRHETLDPRAMERFRTQHPQAYQRWQASEQRNVDALYEGSKPTALDRADAEREERGREGQVLGDRTQALLGRGRQTQAHQAHQRSADERIVASGVQARGYDHANLDVLTLGAHGSSRRGDLGETVVNLATFAGGTAARGAGEATGRAWTEHQQGVQLDRIGSHVDAQRVHDTASEHAMRAGIDTVMLGLSAWGASSLYTGVARRAAAAAQRKAMIAEMRPYPSQRYTVQPVAMPEVGLEGPERATTPTVPAVATPIGEAPCRVAAVPVAGTTSVSELSITSCCSGATKGPRTGSPNSSYTQFSKKGHPFQTTIYDGDGNAIIQIDWTTHGKHAPPGHYHVFPPGKPQLGHGPDAVHHFPFDTDTLPSGWDTPPTHG